MEPEIRRQIHARLPADVLRLSLPLHTLADIRRARALPYDGICQGLSRNPVPGKGRLPLIADANAYDPRSVNIFRQPGYHIDYILIDLDRVMGHPAFFINDLLMGLIRPLDQASASSNSSAFVPWVLWSMLIIYFSAILLLLLYQEAAYNRAFSTSSLSGMEQSPPGGTPRSQMPLPPEPGHPAPAFHRSPTK